jgi:LPXTG-motif cell wall-anchored protein
MNRTTPGATRLGLGATALAAITMVVATAGPAAADPVSAGEAAAFGGQVQLTGQDVLPPTALAEASLGDGDVDVEESAIEIPGDPLLISGTLNGSAKVHVESDIPSSLAAAQEVEGPYNAVGLGSVEELEVLVGQLPEGQSLISAGVLRAEAAAVCRGGQVTYTANSEIIDLKIGGEVVPLDDPLSELLAGINQGLEESGLNQLADIQENVVTPTEDGISVDALVVTVLSAAGEVPLATLRFGHAEVGGLTCDSGGGDRPECSDGIDNDGDGLIDADDPACHTDGDPTNPDSYDPDHDSESEDALPGAPQPSPDGATPPQQRTLPATGGDSTSALALTGLLGAGALGMVALRRRLF